MSTAQQKRKPLPVRLPGELVERIDKLRGLVPRETYVRELLGKAVATEERNATKARKR